MKKIVILLKEKAKRETVLLKEKAEKTKMLLKEKAEKTKMLLKEKAKKTKMFITREMAKKRFVKMGILVGIVVMVSIGGNMLRKYYYDTKYTECINDAKNKMNNCQFEDVREILKNGKEIKYANKKEIEKLLSENNEKWEEYNKERYNELYKASLAYSKQKNLKMLKKCYDEAITLKPLDEKMYLLMSKYYLNIHDYKNSIKILDDGISIMEKSSKKGKVSNLKKNKKQYTIIKQKVEIYNENYKTLYTLAKKCFENKKLSKQLMNFLDKDEVKQILGVTKVNYYANNKFLNGDVTKKNVMVVYSKESIYYGGVEKNKRSAEGIFLTKLNNEYYFYSGIWKYDMPNGKGKVEHIVDKKIESTTTGNFLDGYENGEMTISKSCGKMEYVAKCGKPQKMKNDDKKELTTIDDKNVIGFYYKNGKKKQVALVDKDTIWKVEGLDYK